MFRAYILEFSFISPVFMNRPPVHKYEEKFMEFRFMFSNDVQVQQFSSPSPHGFASSQVKSKSALLKN